MKILDLSLTYHWYDEIASGRKKEEYRKITPFYKTRFMSGYNQKNPTCTNLCSICLYLLVEKCGALRYDAIRFHRGQGSKTTMLVEWKGLSIGLGKKEWGAPLNEKVYIIHLGSILPEKSEAPNLPH